MLTSLHPCKTLNNENAKKMPIKITHIFQLLRKTNIHHHRLLTPPPPSIKNEDEKKPRALPATAIERGFLK